MLRESIFESEQRGYLQEVWNDNMWLEDDVFHIYGVLMGYDYRLCMYSAVITQPFPGKIRECTLFVD